MWLGELLHQLCFMPPRNVLGSGAAPLNSAPEKSNPGCSAWNRSLIICCRVSSTSIALSWVQKSEEHVIVLACRDGSVEALGRTFFFPHKTYPFMALKSRIPSQTMPWFREGYITHIIIWKHGISDVAVMTQVARCKEDRDRAVPPNQSTNSTHPYTRCSHLQELYQKTLPERSRRVMPCLLSLVAGSQLATHLAERRPSLTHINEDNSTF